MLAGVILLRGPVRIAAGLATVLCAVVLLFAGPSLVIAFAVAVAAILYRKFERVVRLPASVNE